MRIVLHVLTGAKSGHTARFDGRRMQRLRIGRHPASDFQFDPTKDRDVSGRHAEIIGSGNGTRFTIRDAGSTNGTWVNGDRLERDHVLADGDVIAFGASGPRMEFHVDRRFHWTRRRVWMTVGGAAGFAAGIIVAYSATHRAARKRESALDALLRKSDSVNQVLSASVRDVSSRASGLDSALSAAQHESEGLRTRLAAEQRGSAQAAADVAQLKHSESREKLLATASRVDYAKIARSKGPAVVLIAVEMPDGHAFTGTGFSVSTAGLVVTNRHLVRADDGTAAQRMLLIFSDTKRWVPAHVVKVSADADLAFLQIDETGAYPAIAPPPASAKPPGVGSPAAIIGYPLGIDTPMEGSGMQITARSTLVAGTLSKVLDDVIQMDSFAGEGSSGSPVFDADGNVIGVVYGGARESAGRIVYAVPATVLARELPN
jgi:S1-C subfamily serine protease